MIIFSNFFYFVVGQGLCYCSFSNAFTDNSMHLEGFVRIPVLFQLSYENHNRLKVHTYYGLNKHFINGLF